MLKNPRTFRGGYRFGNYTAQPCCFLEESIIPPTVIIPLRQGFGTEVKSLVAIGDRVNAGQIIGRDDNTISSPVHSSVNGTVTDIKRMNYFKREITMVVIKTDNSKNEIQQLDGASPSWWKLHNEKIEELIYLSGVSSLDRQGIPTRFKSSIIFPEDVKHLIIHGIASEPYNISLDLLLNGKNLLYFFEGVKILKRIMPGTKVDLAINFKKTKIIEQLEKLSSELEWLDIYPLEPKYPQGYDEILIPAILQQKFPYGYSAANIGVIILNIQAVLAVYYAVTNGMPLVERIVALCGQSFKETLHQKVRVGTPLCNFVEKRIRKEYPSRVVMNSLLTGFELNNFSLPVDRTFSQIIAIPENRERELFAFMRPGAKKDSYTNAFISKWLPIRKSPDTNRHGEERPCISCTFCESVCPVQIIPHLLSRYVKRDNIDETLMNYGIFNCLECGLCSFVCPSKIPLLAHIKEGQEKLINQGCDRTQCILPYFNLKGIEEYRGITKL